jgi:predicted nucleotidyltransferase component of viral defense system
MAREEFDALVERAMAASGHAHMRPVIEKELLHYDILHSLDRHRLLDRLVFQGGTCLRLIYGAPRFSEDLDFVGGTDFATAHLPNHSTRSWPTS